MGIRTVDWKTKEALAKGMNMDSLLYAYQDCIAARDASKGWNPENENYYQDEASVYAGEMRRRKEKLSKRSA